jgi:hypothetical protein
MEQTYVDMRGVEIFDAIFFENLQELLFVIKLSNTDCPPDDLRKLGVWRHLG